MIALLLKHIQSLFFQIANQLQRGFDEFFPPSSNVRIIAEPGTFFAESTYTLVCKILTVKQPIPIKENSESGRNETVRSSFQI